MAEPLYLVGAPARRTPGPDYETRHTKKKAMRLPLSLLAEMRRHSPLGTLSAHINEAILASVRRHDPTDGAPAPAPDAPEEPLLEATRAAYEERREAESRALMGGLRRVRNGNDPRRLIVLRLWRPVIEALESRVPRGLQTAAVIRAIEEWLAATRAPLVMPDGEVLPRQREPFFPGMERAGVDPRRRSPSYRRPGSRFPGLRSLARAAGAAR